MNPPRPATASFPEVKCVVVATLGIEDRADSVGPDTELLGGFAEFDSMAVLELTVALENRFGITFDDEEITAEVFATIGTLAELVGRKTI